MHSMPRRVLVTGATGMVGPGVLRALLRDGWHVRVLVRDASRAPADCTVAVGDMTDAESLRAACRNVDAVVHVAARKNDECDSVAVNIEGARLLAHVAAQEGVQRIIHLSTQSVRLGRRGTYGETKLQAERALDAGRVPVAHLRASVIYGDMPDGIVGSILGFARLPFIPVIGDGRPHFRPMHRDDLGSVIAAMLALPEATGVFDVGGREEYTYDELVRVIVAAQGLRRPLVHLPLFLALPMARALRALLPKPPITVSNVLGAADDVRFDPSPILTLTAVEPRSFRASLAAMLPLRAVAPDAEARYLLSYVGRGCALPVATDALTERYLRALRAHGVAEQATLAALPGYAAMLAHDWATRLRAPGCALQKKLLIAAAIREADVGSAALLPPTQSALAVAWNLLRTGVACVVIVPLCLIFMLSHGRR